MAFMRHNNNGRRHNNNRHRHQHQSNSQQQNQRRHVNRINHVFESNGPEGRVRGTAQQIVEKYLTMARDAQSAGDKVLSMNYSQHAEHYQRLQNEILEENATFERDREATRAAQQAAQPDLSASDADAGFAGMAAGSGAEPAENNRADAPRSETRTPRAPSGEGRGRPVRGERSVPRAAASSRADDGDVNSLPGFLQVPIRESAPPEQPASASAATSAAPDSAAVTADAPAPVAERKPRAPRARRTETPPADAAE